MGAYTKDKFPKFTELNELASEKNGGRIIFATDDWFAAAENLLKDDEPVWKDGLFTECGKWMDGWETKRKRCTGHDWTVIELGSPAKIRGICVDTAFFTGNYSPRFSLQASKLSDKDATGFPERDGKIGTFASGEAFEQISGLKTENWETLIPVTELGAGYPETRRNYFSISSDETWTHLRLNMFPDGGIARLRVYGLSAPDWSKVDHEQELDLIAKENGAVCEGYSDAHYGHPRNLIRPGRGINMGDGWETARRLDRPPILEADDNGILQVPGNEWAIFRLGHAGQINHIEVDTIHFKGNYPDSVKLEGALANPGQNTDQLVWRTIMTPKKLSPHKQHFFTSEDLVWEGPISHVKVTIAPDGGISRLRLWGYLTD